MINKKRNNLYVFLTLACLAGYALLFYGFSTTQLKAYPVEVCIIKHTTGMPCPSCGSTRSVLEILQGNYADAMFANPLGYVISLFLLIVPFWLSVDVVTKSKSLFYNYRKAEALLRQPAFFLPSIFIVLANWIWNIAKGI